MNNNHQQQQQQQLPWPCLLLSNRVIKLSSSLFSSSSSSSSLSLSSMSFLLLFILLILFPINSNASGGGGGGGSKYQFPEKEQQSIYIPLIEYLKSDYQPLAMPVCQPGEKMHVKLDMWLYQLFDLEEVTQMLTIDAWLEMSWFDCTLSWHPSNFSNIQQLTLPAAEIWHPDIINYESLHGNFEEGMFLFGSSTARINYDGKVQLGAQMLLKTFCRFHVENFPFDTQVCNITFSSWNKDASVFRLTSRDADEAEQEDLLKSTKQNKIKNDASAADGGASHGWDPNDKKATYRGHAFESASNGEWRVIGFPSYNVMNKYKVGATEDNELNYTEVHYQLILERKTTYVEVYLIYPCLILIWIGALTFILPVECGEKIGLAITVMLSLIVFLLLVADNIPRSSDGVPILAIFYAICIGIVFLGVVMTTIVLNVGTKSANIDMPYCLHRFLRHRIGMLLCFRYSDTHASHKWLSIKAKRKQKRSSPFITTPTSGGGGAGGGGRGIGMATINNDYTMEDLEVNNLIGNNRMVKETGVNPCDVAMCEKNDWRFLALLLDRLFFIIYVILALIVTLYITLQQPGRGFSHHSEPNEGK